MKTIVSTLLLLLTVNFSQAQIAFRTGDKGFDAELNVMNTEAKRDLSKFKEEAAKEFNLSKEKIQALLDKKMEPAEIVLSGRLSKITLKPIEVVVTSYENNKDKGWGAIAKDLGIKPGSAEFHALKGKSKGKKDKHEHKEKSKESHSKGKKKN